MRRLLVTSDRLRGSDCGPAGSGGPAGQGVDDRPRPAHRDQGLFRDNGTEVTMSFFSMTPFIATQQALARTAVGRL